MALYRASQLPPSLASRQRWAPKWWPTTRSWWVRQYSILWQWWPCPLFLSALWSWPDHWRTEPIGWKTETLLDMGEPQASDQAMGKATVRAGEQLHTCPIHKVSLQALQLGESRNIPETKPEPQSVHHRVPICQTAWGLRSSCWVWHDNDPHTVAGNWQ